MAASMTSASPLIQVNQGTVPETTGTRSIADQPAPASLQVTPDILASIQKYINLAAAAAIATQQVVTEAPSSTKMETALKFVNVGLGVAATSVPGLAPILGMVSGLESPFAHMITGLVGLFKAHGQHGFKPSGNAAPIPVNTVPVPVPTVDLLAIKAAEKKAKIAAAQQALLDAENS